MIKRFKVYNLECAHCAAKMEREIKKMSSINDAEVNFMLQSIVVDFKDENIDAEIGKIQKICKKIEPDCVVRA
ncbi:MAG: heavy-metal-associated domain-containing protein [Clostridia bacterium]|nr:heavy-metal-associated domain-containing protein [Clostridia bacterium]